MKGVAGLPGAGQQNLQPKDDRHPHPRFFDSKEVRVNARNQVWVWATTGNSFLGNYDQELPGPISLLNPEVVARVAGTLGEAWQHGSKLFCVGSGGSSAIGVIPEALPMHRGQSDTASWPGTWHTNLISQS